VKALNYFGLELGESSFGALKLVGGVGAFFGGCQVLCEGRLGQIGDQIHFRSSVAS
jgi:hypothetical protein